MIKEKVSFDSPRCIWSTVKYQSKFSWFLRGFWNCFISIGSFYFDLEFVNLFFERYIDKKENVCKWLWIHCMKSVQIWSFFWSVFSLNGTEYGDILSKSLYSVQIRENTDQKKLRIWTLFTRWLFSLNKYMWSRDICLFFKAYTLSI